MQLLIPETWPGLYFLTKWLVDCEDADPDALRTSRLPTDLLYSRTVSMQVKTKTAGCTWKQALPHVSLQESGH
jgi:hypothetical protein